MVIFLILISLILAGLHLYIMPHPGNNDLYIMPQIGMIFKIIIRYFRRIAQEVAIQHQDLIPTHCYTLQR